MEERKLIDIPKSTMDMLTRCVAALKPPPELTLSQLAELFDPPITKSALNHRLRKLIALAEKAKGDKL